MFKRYKSYVIDVVKEKCPFKKRSKFSYEYYFDMFRIMLNDTNSWKALSRLSDCQSDSRYHYTTIRKMFNRWSKHNVFSIAYHKMLCDNNLNLPKLKGVDRSIDLFIDATFVDNKTGSELVNVNPLYYKKNVTKLSIICDSKKTPLSITPFKSTTNDSITVIDSLKPLNIRRRVNLIADKGYVMNRHKKQILLKQYKVRLIVPKKKNQKKVRLSAFAKSKLRIRNVVENCIRTLKAYNRIMVRKDRLLINFMSFVHLGAGIRLDERLSWII